MLTEGLYNILNTGVDESGANLYLVKLNAGHPVFQGHFPGRPILPGVLMVQLVQHLVEQHTGTKLHMQQAKKIKFLAAVNPQQGTELSLKVSVTNQAGGYSADASAMFLSQPCFKINAQYTIES